MIEVIEGRLHRDIARVDADLRLDRGDLADKDTTRIGIDADIHGLAELQVRAVLFGDGEIHPDLREIGERHDLRASTEELTEFDMPQAELATERRENELLRDERLGLGDVGLRLVIGGLRVVNRRLRAELTQGERLGAVERQFRGERLRLEIRQIAAVGIVEQLHDGLALDDMRARLEHDFHDAAGDICRHIDLMHGDDIADAGEKNSVEPRF